jgi:hypothetical protein
MRVAIFTATDVYEKGDGIAVTFDETAMPCHGRGHDEDWSRDSTLSTGSPGEEQARSLLPSVPRSRLSVVSVRMRMLEINPGAESDLDARAQLRTCREESVL